MRRKSTSFEFFIFLLSFLFLSFVLQDSAFADCVSPMGLPGEACCMPEDPNTPCCAVLDMCDFTIQCECNSGSHCDLAPSTSMKYMVCYPDDIECGEEVGQPCCEQAGSGGSIWVCNHPDTLACNFSTQKCQLCGSEGQLCCNNSTKCDSGLECYGGVCKNPGNEPTTDCNEENEICCYNWGVGGGNTCQIIDGTPPNFEECYCQGGGDLVCTRSDTVGRCTNPNSCGGDGQECCEYPIEPPCDSGLECSTTLNICGHWYNPNPPGPPSLIYNGPVIENLEDILGPVTRMLYYGGLAIGIFFIILSGYRLMTSEGDPQRVKGAQEQLTSAIIGIVFILLSVTIIRVIIDEIINL